jgi:hypothetical protein
MTKFNNQTTKSQVDYTSNNKQPDLPMYKHTEIQRPEPIIPPTFEVRLKTHVRRNKIIIIN